MIITFCGHGTLRNCEEIKERLLLLLKSLIADGECDLYLGGYGDFDRLARECGSILKTGNPKIKLFFITPYITESYQKNRLELVRDSYDGIIYPAIERVPYRYAILCRNRWMVEEADVVVAYIDHGFGGAYKTFRYALRRGKRVINIGSFHSEGEP